MRMAAHLKYTGKLRLLFFFLCAVARFFAVGFTPRDEILVPRGLWGSPQKVSGARFQGATSAGSVPMLRGIAWEGRLGMGLDGTIPDGEGQWDDMGRQCR